MALQNNFRRKGAGYIEVLVSTIILVVCLLAAISLFGFSMKLVDKTGDEGVAYNIARKCLEDVRQMGFSGTNIPDGTVTTYWDSKGNKLNAAGSTARFILVRKVTSDKTSTTSTGTQPADDAIRSVEVNVYYYPTISVNTRIEQTGTILVRSGV